MKVEYYMKKDGLCVEIDAAYSVATSLAPEHI